VESQTKREVVLIHQFISNYHAIAAIFLGCQLEDNRDTLYNIDQSHKVWKSLFWANVSCVTYCKSISMLYVYVV